MKKPQNGVLGLRIPFQSLWIKRNFIQSPLIERGRIMQKSCDKINARRGSGDPQSNAHRVGTINYEGPHRDAHSSHVPDEAMDRDENSTNGHLVKTERSQRVCRDERLQSSAAPNAESSTSRSSHALVIFIFSILK
jgi:hypothetical protein